MPRYQITAPDGGKFEVTAPDGASEADVMAYAQKQFAAQTPTIAKPAAVSVGDAVRDIPRQVGMFARYGIESAGQLANIGTEPIRQMLVNPALNALGMRGAKDTGSVATDVANALGLPQPQNANERVIGDATRMVGSSALMGGAANKAAQYAAPMARNVLQQLAANQGTQTAGAAGAGLAGGAVRESGGGPWEQLGAALAGGLTGAGLAQSANRLAGSMVSGAKNLLTPASVQTQQAEQSISLLMDRAGIDWSVVPERIKQGMRAEVSAALQTGQPLDAAALRRLLVFKRADVTPTVGQLTQDPGTITRETNLAKTGANSTDPALQRLPLLQNANTASLLRQLDEAGAATAPNAAGAAREAIDAMGSTVSKSQANIDKLYQAARDTQGRSVVLDGPAAAQAAVRKLQADNVGKLPTDIDEILNKLTSGETPLTVDYQQQLVKNLFRRMKGAGDNGDLRYGLGVVRQALDDADVPLSKSVNPGNLPAVNGTVPTSTATLGDESIAAYRTARTANREWRARVEANPALKAVEEGVEPDQFVQRYIVGKSATAKDVRALRNELTPEAELAMKAYLVRHLKGAATNNTDDITKFSNDAYRRAMRDIGEDKLRVFFNQEEMQHLTDLGDAAKYMQAQPSGSAVNNSNTAAMALGRGMDWLEKMASASPIGGQWLRGKIQGSQQTQLLAPRNALALPAPARPPVRLNPLLAGVAAEQRSNDDGR
jgi:hypothetical protein